MFSLRRLVTAHRAFAAALLTLALAMKLLVPAGFMPFMAGGQIVISICSGAEAVMVTIPSVNHKDSQHARAEQPCTFAGLSMPSLAAADPVLLALATLFAMVLTLQPCVVPVATSPPYLRPPSCGPPITD